MRTIFHVDVNSAFLSWSALKLLKENPDGLDLRTVASAVGGDVETRHGIITAKSIPAKKYGIQTGEPVVKALAKCPDLILVKPDFHTYKEYSGLLMGLLRRYTPYVQQASIDEAYMDVSEIAGEDPVKLAREIADQVRNSYGFTVNVGVSSNKFLAKTASDFSKPDKVHTLYPAEIPEKLWPMPIEDMHGCGRATAARLHGMGIHTIKEAALSDLAFLQTILGNKAGQYIHDRANGRDESPVEYQEREPKSYSNETTLSLDVDRGNYQAIAVPVLRELCTKVAGRLRKDHVCGSTVSFMAKTGAFQRHSRQTTLAASTDDKAMIFEQAKRLMDGLLLAPGGLFSEGEVIRLIGVGVSNLDNGENRQMTLTEWAEIRKEQEAEREKNRRLALMVENVQRRFGKDAVRKGM